MAGLTVGGEEVQIIARHDMGFVPNDVVDAGLAMIIFGAHGLESLLEVFASVPTDLGFSPFEDVEEHTVKVGVGQHLLQTVVVNAANADSFVEGSLLIRGKKESTEEYVENAVLDVGLLASLFDFPLMPGRMELHMLVSISC